MKNVILILERFSDDSWYSTQIDLVELLEELHTAVDNGTFNRIQHMLF